MGSILRTLLKIGGSIVAYVIAFILFSNVMNKGNADMSATMKSATFPLVYIDIDNMDVNCMHGFTGDMQGNYLRDTITPLQEQRSIPIKIKTYGPTIKGISFEVRSMDMQRLVEDTEVTEYSQEDADGYVSAVLYLKDLIEPETEYMLVLKLISGTGQEIKYYTRIFDPGALYLTEKMDFIMDFHHKIFDKEQAKELIKYMETNAEGDNSSFGNVNIHSNFEQLTWGDLNPQIVTKENVSIKEVDAEYANVTIKYRVAVGSDLFDVCEFYRVRRGSERIYLMDYERTMDQIFDTDHTVLVKDQLLLGISSEEPHMQESEDGSKLCFVKQNTLYSYDNTEGYLARLFSFYDDENNDERTIYADHGIKILSMENDGEVRFLVYGYMNRGKHEGEVGSAVYKYMPVSNSIEEEVFIPYSKSYELLKQDIACLSYVNKQERLYMLSGQTIYEIDLENKVCEKVISGLLPNRFVVSDDDSLIAWQEGESLYDSDKIILDTLKSVKKNEIVSEPGTTIIPLGFMDEDFIYGMARKNDITHDSMGRTVMPMYTVRIEDKNGEILKEYKKNEIYVTKIEINNNVIDLTRIQKNPETGNYTMIDNDQIMNNVIETTGKNVIKEVVTKERETTLQVTLLRETEYKMSKLLTPKEMLYEGDREMRLEREKEILASYYVYAKGKLLDVFSSPSDAVNEAATQSGVVINDNGSYIWESGSKASRKLINSIDEEMATEEISSYEICLREMLRTKGAVVAVDELLGKQMTPMEILRENMPAKVLDLTGCPLNVVFYYLNQNIPVMVPLGDGECVLIVGYDEKNVILFRPNEGTIKKMGNNDATNMFSEYGNKYITYVNE